MDPTFFLLYVVFFSSSSFAQSHRRTCTAPHRTALQTHPRPRPRHRSSRTLSLSFPVSCAVHSAYIHTSCGVRTNPTHLPRISPPTYSNCSVSPHERLRARMLGTSPAPGPVAVPDSQTLVQNRRRRRRLPPLLLPSATRYPHHLNRASHVARGSSARYTPPPKASAQRPHVQISPPSPLSPHRHRRRPLRTGSADADASPIHICYTAAVLASAGTRLTAGVLILFIRAPAWPSGSAWVLAAGCWLL
ncbi:hypothetical protein C8Q78DRAFT_824871 [Trametes maxima]|nr:hypothetical protein C8Q78DRAFT_824871 [Trametes maxima]